MKGLIIDLEVPYFSTFRKTTSSSLIMSYSVPPFTTIRGMFANALGLVRDDLSLQDSLKIGIKILESGVKNVEMAKILKLKKAKGEFVKDYPSSPMSREYMVNGKYRIYVCGEKECIVDLHKALNNPFRSLYIGQSDELVDIRVSDMIDVTEEDSDIFNSAVAEIVSGATLENLPFKFQKLTNWKIEYQRLSFPNNYPVQIKDMVKAYKFNQEFVQLF
jgi:CRISPR-associated protein Cas5h